VPWSDSLQEKFKNNTEAAADLRQALKDKLMEELVKRYVSELPFSKEDNVNNYLVYDVAGYMAKTRGGVLQLDECDECKCSVISKEEDLPSDFDADKYTSSRTQGGLVFVTVPMYQTLNAIERVVTDHFKSLDHIYIPDTYHECINKVSLINVIPLFCDAHRDANMATLIMEYVKVRYYFESKRLKDVLLSKEQSQIKASFKLATTAHTSDVQIVNKK